MDAFAEPAVGTERIDDDVIQGHTSAATQGHKDSGAQEYRAPLKIHFGGQANLFDSGRRQAKTTLASTKADLPSLPELKNLLLDAQKQLLERPYRNKYCFLGFSMENADK